MFFRNKLCMCFSSMSLSFTLLAASTWWNKIIVTTLHCQWVVLVAAVPVAVAVAGILSSWSDSLFLSLALPRELRSN